MLWIRLADHCRKHCEIGFDRQPAYGGYDAYDADTLALHVELVACAAEVVAAAADASESARAAVAIDVDSWTWIPSFLDQASYATHVGGCAAVRSRSLGFGRRVRAIHRVANAVSYEVELENQEKKGGRERALANAACSTRDEDVRFRADAASNRFRVSEVEDLSPCYSIDLIVEGCSNNDVNGLYAFDGFFPKGISKQIDDVTPKFVRVGAFGTKYTLYKCSIQGEKRSWYISKLSKKPGTTEDLDFFSSRCVVVSDPLPREDQEWTACGAAVDAVGDPKSMRWKPPRRVVLRQQLVDPTDIDPWRRRRKSSDGDDDPPASSSSSSED